MPLDRNKLEISSKRIPKGIRKTNPLKIGTNHELVTDIANSNSVYGILRNNAWGYPKQRSSNWRSNTDVCTNVDLLWVLLCSRSLTHEKLYPVRSRCHLWHRFNNVVPRPHAILADGHHCNCSNHRLHLCRQISKSAAVRLVGI